jgi:hypothetical protein
MTADTGSGTLPELAGEDACATQEYAINSVAEYSEIKLRFKPQFPQPTFSPLEAAPANTLLVFRR